MPELPEVETIRQYLQTVLPGHTIEAVDRLDARIVKHSPLTADAMVAQLPGKTVTGVERVGKFLLVRFKSKEALVLHLGMSGRLVVGPAEEWYQPHTHLALRVDGQHLRLIDPRRFGRVAWVTQGSALGTRLGVDPLSARFTARRLQELLAGRVVPLKTALLNQALIAGLGNIYADEALFLARLNPKRPAGSLADSDAKTLVRGIRRVLRLALKNRGTSFSDYVDALGHPGDNQRFLNVYGRAQEPCPRCRTPIVLRVIGGRSSHFCPKCQPWTDENHLVAKGE